MKKVSAIILALAMCVAALSGCGASSSSSEQAAPEAASSSPKAAETLSGTLTLGGSTSVEKVIQAMMEAYMAENSGVTITYAPTGSSTGIQGATDKSLDTRNLFRFCAALTGRTNSFRLSLMR